MKDAFWEHKFNVDEKLLLERNHEEENLKVHKQKFGDYI